MGAVRDVGGNFGKTESDQRVESHLANLAGVPAKIFFSYVPLRYKKEYTHRVYLAIGSKDGSGQIEGPTNQNAGVWIGLYDRGHRALDIGGGGRGDAGVLGG